MKKSHYTDAGSSHCKNVLKLLSWVSESKILLRTFCKNFRVLIEEKFIKSATQNKIFISIQKTWTWLWGDLYQAIAIRLQALKFKYYLRSNEFIFQFSICLSLNARTTSNSFDRLSNRVQSIPHLLYTSE